MNFVTFCRPEKPTRDTGVTDESTEKSQPKARKNLGITFQKRKDESHHSAKSQISSKQTPGVSQGQVKKPAVSQSASSKPGQQKKPERKVAVIASKAAHKGSAPAWK